VDYNQFKYLKKDFKSVMKICAAHSLANIQPYFFSSLNKTIEALKARGMDVIRLDMGSPDLPPADFIIEALVESARNPHRHGYSPMGGAPNFLRSVAAYYDVRFNVKLDPNTEIVALIGSKEGIFNISQVLLDPGDLVLLPDPYYPVYMAGSQIAESRISFMPLLKVNGFLPDLKAIPESVAREAKIMWLNYPNNPTGAIASLDYFKEVVEFAAKYEIVIAHDSPYADVTFDGYRAPSILQVEGAKDVAIEFNSLSKTYNMAGWRVGMAVGNPELIQLLKIYKSQMDTSIFAPILDASIKALTGDQSWLEERNAIYEERRDIVYEGLVKAGFEVEKPKAALYLWAKVPQGLGDTMELCVRLLDETGVSITPGVVYGPSGKDYVRISIITPTERINEAMQRMVEWLQKEIK
jgi:LL-diaminopimelate aminotransferase